MLFKSLDPRINAAFSRGSVVAFLFTLTATGLVATATHLNLMNTIAAAVAMLTAAVSLIWVVLPLAVRATGAYLGDADPRMVRLLIASIVATGAITVVAGTMLMTGTYERAMTRADRLATGALDDVTLSPGAALAIGLIAINGLVLVPALASFHVMRNARVVTWERVRACGQLVGWSCMLPITIGLSPAVAGSELTERFPGWIRAWIITCWGIAGLIYLTSALLRRRPLTP